MHWLAIHSGHFPVPVSLYLSILAAVTGYKLRKDKLAGETPSLPPAFTPLLLLSLVGASVLCGVYIGHFYG